MPSHVSGRAAAAVGVLLVAGLLAGCSGSDGDAAPGERPDIPTEPPALWNPCDGLETAAVAAAFGVEFDTRTGTPDAPLCTFTPTVEGGPAVDVNYQLFAGTLDDMLDTFGEQVGGTAEVVTVEIPDADDARIILDPSGGTLAVTGFVRNGRLVQVVNALDPKPYRRDGIRTAVETLLGDLAAHASESGISDEDAPPGASPSDAPSVAPSTTPTG